MYPDRLPVLDQDGSFLFWADEEAARNLIRARKVEILRTNKRDRALRVVKEAAELRREHMDRLHNRSLGDSHRRETRDNPRGVWTLDRLRRKDRAIFLRVALECAA